MNRNSRLFFLSGLGLVTLIFVITILFSRVWPTNEVWYMQNISWLIPLIIVLFWEPVVPLLLSNWDIHFYFQEISDGNLVVIVSNLGTTPFAFNRLQFSSGKKYRILCKREFYPQSGLSDENIVFHGADTLSQTLGQHIGCTLKKGLPITLVIRGHQVPENLRHFKENSKVYLSLYYEGTKQRVYSQRIPSEIVIKIIQNSK